MSEPAVVIPRWIARIWSILLTLLMVVQGSVSVQEAAGGGSLPLADAVELTLLALGLVGLLLAWRREALGAGVTIAAIVLHGIAFRLFRGRWLLSLAGGWIIPTLYIVPAVLFLLATGLDER